MTLLIKNPCGDNLQLLHTVRIAVRGTAAMFEELFLDALASLDFKLSVSESFTFFTTSASTGLSDYFITDDVQLC